MAKKPPPGKCVYCCRNSDDLTWDHIPPESWYPSSAKAGIYKPQVPTCWECNRMLGGFEEDLLTGIGICLDPQGPASQGIFERIKRSINARHGRNEKDSRIREAKGKKLFSKLLRGTSIPSLGIYPGFGVDQNRPLVEQVAIPVNATHLHKVVEKIVRGVCYLQDKKFIEPPYQMEICALNEEDATDLEAALETGEVYEVVPTLRVVRKRTNEDRMSSVFSIELWQRLKIYAFISENED